MIFVVCLVPLGLYLLLLGHLNRQPRPVLVSGVLDFIGVLFGSSGFLLFGGPAILTGLNESWRTFWLLGDTAVSRESLLAQWQFWVFLSALYFAAVVSVCSWQLWRRRQVTSIYNVEPAQVEATLEVACGRYGLTPLRSGNLFVFGPGLGQPRAAGAPEGIQAPHAPSELLQKTPTPRLDVPESRADEFLGQCAELEVETFPAMRHVTLRWEPGDSPLRGVLEAELDHLLGEAGAPYHDTGLWLTMAGYAAMGLALFIAAVAFVRALLVH